MPNAMWKVGATQGLTMKSFLAAATLLALTTPGTATPSIECQTDAEKVTALANQFRNNLHAKPSEADKKAISAWFHHGYGIGLALHGAEEATLTRCDGAIDQSFSQTVANTGRELRRLKQRMDAYDRAAGLAP